MNPERIGGFCLLNSKKLSLNFQEYLERWGKTYEVKQGIKKIQNPGKIRSLKL